MSGRPSRVGRFAYARRDAFRGGAGLRLMTRADAARVPGGGGGGYLIPTTSRRADCYDYRRPGRFLHRLESRVAGGGSAPQRYRSRTSRAERRTGQSSPPTASTLDMEPARTPSLGLTASTLAGILALLLSHTTAVASQEQRKPHIVVILADDLGWNDVSFHGSNQIPTPNIDALAYHGVILNQHYVPALCTPSRASLMTGKYPTHTGMQHLVILEPEPWGLPLEEKLLPEHLSELGYRTHAVGKWHLGYHRREYTPTYRGFESHFGYWNGFQDYFDHTVKATFGQMGGYDMRRNMSVAWDVAGEYSTDLFTREAVRLVREHPDDPDSPLFLYLAHLAPHTGNQDDPFQALDQDIAHFGHIADPERRVYAAMVRRLDEGVGEVVAALRERNMLQDSIVVFMSDNGAPTFGIHSNRGSNFPLRGMKETPWEGGLRGVAAVWSPRISKPGRVSSTLMHVSDWLPTLWSAAGGNTSTLPLLDGVDQWPTLSQGAPPRRLEILHQIDDISKYAAMRRGDWKYVTGNTQGGVADHWFGETGRAEVNPPYVPETVLHSKAGVALAGLGAALQIRGKAPEGFAPLSPSAVLRLRAEAEVRCVSDTEHAVECKPREAPCLFNVRDDPCERVNLAAARPQVVQSLEEALLRYRRTMLPPRNVPTDPLADPALWNGTWTNWCSEQERRHDDDDGQLDLLPDEQQRRPAGAVTAMWLGTMAVLLTASLVSSVGARGLLKGKAALGPLGGSALPRAVLTQWMAMASEGPEGAEHAAAADNTAE